MSLVVILLTWLAVSAGVTAIYAAARYQENIRRERRAAELDARIRASVERIIASM